MQKALLISRMNRDRPGGHDKFFSPILVTNHGYRSGFTKKGRRFFKARVNKQRRREHKKITENALYQHLIDYTDDCMEVWFDQDEDDFYGSDLYDLNMCKDDDCDEPYDYDCFDFLFDEIDYYL